jgi:EAL domain-containing protein (putative c-di-GMP-specific phosphodiesterase class I)
MSLCRRCEVVPEKIETVRDYYLWFPLGHSERKVREALESAAADARRDGPTEAVVLRADPAGFDASARRLIDVLSSEEVKAIRVLPVDPLTGPGAADYQRVTSLREMLSFLEAGWLVDALSREELRIGFAPIAFADAAGEVYGYHATVEVKDAGGRSIPQGRLLQIAQEAGMLFQTDRLARISAIKAAERHKLTTPIFVDFSPASIYDPAFCLRSTVNALEQTEIPRDAICFTIVSPERGDDTKHLRSILDFYRGTGFRVALGGVGSGAASLTLIETLRPDLIFVDPAIMGGVDADPYKQVIVRKLLEMAHRLRIESVISGIATGGELDWAYENGANYVEGPAVTEAAGALPLIEVSGGAPARGAAQ